VRQGKRRNKAEGKERDEAVDEPCVAKGKKRESYR